MIELTLKPNGEHTRKVAAAEALEELIASGRQRRLLDPMGKLDWHAYDYKVERSRE